MELDINKVEALYQSPTEALEEKWIREDIAKNEILQYKKVD